MKEFNVIRSFKPYVSNLPTLKLTIDTSKNKTFTITRLNKGTAPEDLVIDWGDGSKTKYNDLLYSHINNNYSHIYTDDNIYTITMCGSLKESTAMHTSYQNNTNLISVEGNIFMYYNGIEQSTNVYRRNSFFQNCSNLKTITKDIFKLCINIVNFEYCFDGNISLEIIPEGLFNYNTNVITFFKCFNGCKTLTNISKNLFKNNINTSNFSYCFYGCTSLQNIPEDLFRYNTEVIDFSYCFDGCSKIQNIPNGLFDNNTLAVNFNSCFRGCKALTNIPEGLLDNSTHKDKLPPFSKVTTLNYCFNGCTGLVSIPENLFNPGIFSDPNGRIQQMIGCFLNCYNITSAVPDLWDRSKWRIENYDMCFSGCTKAANYDDIPAAWK